MFWKTRKSEESSVLSGQDKKDIMFYACMGGIIAFSLVLAVNGLGIVKSREAEAQAIEELLQTVNAYMSTATDDEYNAYAKKLRNDLILLPYYEDQWQNQSLIENTAEECSIDRFGFGQVYIAAVNTGSLYSLNIAEEEDVEGDNIILTTGYDEISGSSLAIRHESRKNDCDVLVYKERSIISVQKMKQEIRVS